MEACDNLHLQESVTTTSSYLQIYKNGNWTKEHHIEEPYEEGCQTIDDSTYCFCRGSMCNAATKVEKNSYHTDAMSVIFVFNVMKYIRNIEY